MQPGDIEVPGILDDLASAGERGISYPAEPSRVRELDLLRDWEFPLLISAGHVSLRRNDDILVPAWIQEETPAIAWDRLNVVGFLQTGSTNEEALQRCQRGSGHGLMVYAETQTSGRGRLGRSWFSPRGTGIYLSLVFQPGRPIAEWPILAMAASVALAQSLQELQARSDVETPRIELKWPNDVLISGKKVAGFLVETTLAEKRWPAAVLGCGINVSAGAFPADLAQHATAVALETGLAVPRRRLAVRFLTHLQTGYHLLEQGRHAEILQMWKCFSTMWNETPVSILEGSRRWNGVSCGLSENGALLIRDEAGVVETLLAGDVSVRSENRG